MRFIYFYKYLFYNIKNKLMILINADSDYYEY